MNTATNNGQGTGTSSARPPSSRERRHKHLHYASWAAIVMTILGVVALVPYTFATIYQCGGLFNGLGLCEIYSALPWAGAIAVFAVYIFVVWIIHELGHEARQDETDAPGLSRYAWSHAKLGYKDLEKGHHHLVRRAHRVASIALAGVAAYISFQFFEGDTLTNLGVAVAAYIAGELLNWKTYTQITEAEAKDRNA